MKKDFYGILKIDRKAKPEQVKTAYRIAAKRYHPDISPDDEEKFKEIQEAYETLSDPRKRAAYDWELSEKPAVTTLSRPFPFFDRGSSLFDEIDRLVARFEDLWIPDLPGMFGAGGERFDLFVKIILTAAEARNGCHVPIKIPFGAECRRCLGTGRVNGLICGRCRGRGVEELEKEAEITIPPGVEDGTRMRISLLHPDLKEISLIATIQVSYS